MYSAPFHISARRIKNEESPPAFYVHSKGDKAGLPSDTPVPSGYVVYLDETQLIPQYFKYVLMYLNQSGAFKRQEKGAVIPFVRVEDMTDVIYDFFRKQAQSRQVKEAKEKLVGGKGDNKPDSAFNRKQLKIGIKDETGEHTPSKQIGKEIAKDHLASDPDYYKKLKAAGIKQEELEEKWSAKYKRSIDCNNPKGFSQRAHCQGKKKMNETIDEGKNKPTNPSLWSRAKSAARSKFKVYPCVTMDSQALTKTGWKYYSELSVGEDILTYNINDDVTEWKPITHLHFYEKAQIINIRKSTTAFNFKCTPDHKWVIKKNKNHPSQLVETKNLNSHMTIITSAKFREDNKEPLKLEGFSKYGDDWVSNILNMNDDQRKSFFASAIIYDGNHKGYSNKLKRNTYGFSQKNKNHGQALEICALLLGLNVSFFNKKYNPDMTGYTIIEKQSTNTGNLIKEEAGFEDVWCPTTENNTWIMKQNKMITITGNSAYANAWASKWYKKHGGGWRKSKAKNESIELDIVEEVLLTECSCGCNECEVPHSYSLDIMDGSSPYVDEEFDEYEANTEDFINQSKGNPDLNGDGMYDEEELYYHFDLNNDSEVTPDEYESHIEFHTNNPEILNKHIKKIRPVVAHMIEEIWDK